MPGRTDIEIHAVASIELQRFVAPAGPGVHQTSVVVTDDHGNVTIIDLYSARRVTPSIVEKP